MSHFNVLVIGDDVEAALEPHLYYRDDEPGEYLEFVDLETPLRLEYETDGEEKEVHLANGEVLQGWDTRFFSLENSKFSYPEDAKIVVTRPYREQYPTFEAFVKEFEGIQERNPIKGIYGYWENPNAKYTWMQLGGRWQGFFKLKAGATGKFGEAPSRLGRSMLRSKENDGTLADQCRVSSIDFEGTALMVHQQAGEEWDAATASGLSVLRSLQIFGPNRDDYCARAARTFMGVAAVVLDGKWYQPGDATPWCPGSEDISREAWADSVATMVQNLPGDTQISLVDCHS